MPFDAGAPITSAERLLAKRERVAAEAVVDVALLATLKKRGGLDQTRLRAKDSPRGQFDESYGSGAERGDRAGDTDSHHWRAD